MASGSATWFINSSAAELLFFSLNPLVICGLFAVIVNTERCAFNVEGTKESVWGSWKRVVSFDDLQKCECRKVPAC